MPDASLQSVVDAINDLTRITIAVHGDFASKSEAVRRLSELSIPTGRIASILAMSPNDVSSALSKARKNATRRTVPENSTAIVDATEARND